VEAGVEEREQQHGTLVLPLEGSVQMRLQSESGGAEGQEEDI
jgi:hypothetical protein